ncbi:MAG: helix-turn-helix domain-containing protein [Burkholderiales bacterium]
MTDKQFVYLPDVVSAPGETLKELLDERGMTQKDLSARTGRPLKTINEIVKGKAQITPETAVQFERALGLPAAFWNQREAHYRGYLARVQADKQAERWLSWLDELPLKEMMAAGVLPATRLSPATRHRLLDISLKFFGVASPEDWQKVYSRPQAAYRRSMTRASDVGAVAVWLRLGELESQRSDCADFDARTFHMALDEIRKLTLLEPAKFLPKVHQLCANSGVVLALVPGLPRAHVAGAARWVNKRAVIQLSLYGKFNDRFWFTFFHEACHILKHGRGEVFLDDLSGSGKQSDYEKEADAFAANLLIPPHRSEALSSLRSEAAVRKFASDMGIHPGIVVGRLQHDGLLPFVRMNHLKVKYQWAQEIE